MIFFSIFYQIPLRKRHMLELKYHTYFILFSIKVFFTDMMQSKLLNIFLSDIRNRIIDVQRYLRDKEGGGKLLEAPR